MSNAQNVKLGPCSISINGADVGHTIGGAILTYTPTYHDTVVDKYGKTVVEKFLVSEKLTVEASIAEFTFANLQTAIPQGIKNVGGTKITMGSIPAKRASASAAVIVMHPLENGAGDKSGDVVLYKAVVIGPVAVDYKSDGERMLKVQFEALVNENNADGNLLGLIGDSTT